MLINLLSPSSTGGNKTDVDWVNYMFPQVNDRCGFHMLEDMLLQLENYVPEEEFRNRTSTSTM